MTSQQFHVGPVHHTSQRCGGIAARIESAAHGEASVKEILNTTVRSAPGGAIGLVGFEG